MLVQHEQLFDLAGNLLNLGLIMYDEEVDSCFLAFQQGWLDPIFIILAIRLLRNLEQDIKICNKFFLEFCKVVLMLREDLGNVDACEVFDNICKDNCEIRV